MNDWYKKLKKAPWTPPDYVFGIVWPILYLFMLIAVIIVYFDEKCYPYCYPITVFFIQLGLNLIWTTIFFKLKLPILALIDLILIIGLTIYTITLFYDINKIASYLLVPYILWSGIAFSLNLYIVLNNKLLNN